MILHILHIMSGCIDRGASGAVTGVAGGRDEQEKRAYRFKEQNTS